MTLEEYAVEKLKRLEKENEELKERNYELMRKTMDLKRWKHTITAEIQKELRSPWNDSASAINSDNEHIFFFSRKSPEGIYEGRCPTLYNLLCLLNANAKETSFIGLEIGQEVRFNIIEDGEIARTAQGKILSCDSQLITLEGCPMPFSINEVVNLEVIKNGEI